MKLATAVVDIAVAEVAFEGPRDPNVIGLALLCRSISNIKGALTMAQDNQAVELGVVLCCRVGNHVGLRRPPGGAEGIVRRETGKE
jgi:predicted hotdog family 3-hydroxylacyl-ACP dehydratase